MPAMQSQLNSLLAGAAKSHLRASWRDTACNAKFDHNILTKTIDCANPSIGWDESVCTSERKPIQRSNLSFWYTAANQI